MEKLVNQKAEDGWEFTDGGIDYQNLWVGLYLGRIIFPGWGHEQALVTEVVGRLKARQRLRGDTGQIRRSEHNAIMLQEINNKLDCIICHLNIDYGN